MLRLGAIALIGCMAAPRPAWCQDSRLALSPERIFALGLSQLPPDAVIDASLVSRFGIRERGPSATGYGLTGARLRVDAIVGVSLFGRFALRAALPVVLHTNPDDSLSPTDVSLDPVRFEGDVVLRRRCHGIMGAALHLWGDVPLVHPTGSYRYGLSMSLDGHFFTGIIVALNGGFGFGSGAGFEGVHLDSMSGGVGIQVWLLRWLAVEAEVHAFFSFVGTGSTEIDALAGFRLKTDGGLGVTLGAGGRLDDAGSPELRFALAFDLQTTFARARLSDDGDYELAPPGRPRHAPPGESPANASPEEPDCIDEEGGDAGVQEHHAPGFPPPPRHRVLKPCPKKPGILDYLFDALLEKLGVSRERAMAALAEEAERWRVLSETRDEVEQLTRDRARDRAGADESRRAEENYRRIAQQRGTPRSPEARPPGMNAHQEALGRMEEASHQADILIKDPIREAAQLAAENAATGAAVKVGIGIVGAAGTLAGKVSLRVVNSKMGHAAERAVQRAGLASNKDATEALRSFGERIEAGGLPAGTVKDAAGHLVVPGFGDGGAVVYRRSGDKLTLQTVINWIPGKGTPLAP